MIESAKLLPEGGVFELSSVALGDEALASPGGHFANQFIGDDASLSTTENKPLQDDVRCRNVDGYFRHKVVHAVESLNSEIKKTY